MNTFLLIFNILFCVNLVLCVTINGYDINSDINVEHHINASLIFNDNKGTGNPLYLTKYIKHGRLAEARKAAIVKPFVGKVKSYSGYLTVNNKYHSNLFFWYFRSEKNYKNAPTVIWLQGGPGDNMYSAVFNEIGPYVIGKDKIYKRKYAWNKISNLIFFDNPVGTGYSFTNHNAGYATSQKMVADDLYTAVNQLFTLFPYLRKNDLYIAGVSYAGKYVPALGHKIHLNSRKFKLKGLLIGDGFTDPVNMLKYSEYLYNIGLIDDKVRLEFKQLENKAANLIKQKKWHEASILFNKVMGETNTSLFYNVTGFEGYYNFVNPKMASNGNEGNFIVSTNFRRHIHVGNKELNNGLKVFGHLFDDIPKSVIKWVTELLKHYKIIFYNGQLDVLCAYPLMENFLKKMKWPLSKQYKNAQRHIYRVGDDVAGYYKTVGHLTEMLIRDAGHVVTFNQPIWTYHIFKDFITNKKFSRNVKNVDYDKNIIWDQENSL